MYYTPISLRDSFIYDIFYNKITKHYVIITPNLPTKQCVIFINNNKMNYIKCGHGHTYVFKLYSENYVNVTRAIEIKVQTENDIKIYKNMNI